jgi:hypothetical protein
MRDGVCDSGSGARAAFSCSMRTGGGAAGAIFVPNVGSGRKSAAETERVRRRPGCPDEYGSHGGLLTMPGPHDERHARRAIGIGARGWAAGVSVPTGTPGHAVRAKNNLRRPEPAVKRTSATQISGYGRGDSSGDTTSAGRGAPTPLRPRASRTQPMAGYPPGRRATAAGARPGVRASRPRVPARRVGAGARRPEGRPGPPAVHPIPQPGRASCAPIASVPLDRIPPTP